MTTSPPSSESTKYKTLSILGEGTYGKVFQALNTQTNQTVAIKKVKASVGAEGLHFTTIREIKTMKAVGNHPNVVSLLDIFIEGSSLALVMPYLQMDLKQLIADRSVVLSMSHIKCIMKQLIAGTAALHAKWILHRDLAPANVLIETSTGLLKLADFGLSRSFGSPYPGVLGRKRTFGGLMTSMVVTLWYRSPELLFGAQQYGGGVDVWSLACIFSELFPRMASGEASATTTFQVRAPLFPAQSETEQLQKIFELLGTPTDQTWRDSSNFRHFMRFTHLPPPEGSWPKDLFSIDAAPETDQILSAMLNLDPRKRPSCSELLASGYLNGSVAPRPCSEAALAKQVLCHIRSK